MTLLSKMMPKIIMGMLVMSLALPLGIAWLPVAAMAQEAPTPTAYSQKQLDQLVAPIALYPDPLIAQVLMASTYPLEIVEATRWLKRSDNIGLQGDQLAAALEQQPWDPSVKALVNVPQVLAMLDGNLQWTEQLGDAFLGQQAAVMDSVQHLRGMAQSSGNLASTPQQNVAVQQGAIAITPANPDVVYVPYYNPAVVYGTWPYPAYQPYYFPPPDNYYYAATGIISFGVGLALIDTFWDWDRWDWRGHRIDIDDRRYAYLNRGHGPEVSGHWEHDPAHRHGVPYTSAAVRSQFQARSDEVRLNYRGYASASEPSSNATHVNANSRAYTTQLSSQQQNRVETGQQRITPQTQARTQAVEQLREGRNQQAYEMQPRASAPAFESFSQRSEVQRQSARGSYSRASIAPAAPAESRAAPAAHFEGGGGGRPADGPAGSGDHGGGGHNQR